MENHNYVVILVGVCGTGKSSIGEQVAKRLEVPFFDVDKLSVSDKVPEGSLPQEVHLKSWLTSVEELIATQSTRKGCVISCSILKKEHRKTLTSNIDHPLDWVFMKSSYQYVAQRVEEQGDRDRPASLIKADFETLEIPKRALTVDMDASESEITDTILKYLARKYE